LVSELVLFILRFNHPRVNLYY